MYERPLLRQTAINESHVGGGVKELALGLLCHKWIFLINLASTPEFIDVRRVALFTRKRNSSIDMVVAVTPA